MDAAGVASASSTPAVLTLHPGRRRAAAAAPRWARGRSWRRRAGGSRSGSPWCSPEPGAAAAAPPPPCARGYTPRAGGEKPQGETGVKQNSQEGSSLAFRRSADGPEKVRQGHCTAFPTGINLGSQR